MKDLVKLYSAQEAYNYIDKLWKTDLFRNSSYINHWVNKVILHPMVFAEMSNEEEEYPHFGTWFGLTYLRHYDNPVVNDLYYLHEFIHSSLLANKYERDVPFSRWYRRMNTIEFDASLETEAYIYLEIPGLRAVSFKDDIWADRYLNNREDKDTIKGIMRQERHHAMANPDPMDYCQQQIAAYARQNFEWANVWKLDSTFGDTPSAPAYLKVENHMHDFRAGKMTLDRHVEWLESGGYVPFGVQAQLFADVYWSNKLSYKLKQVVG